MTITLQPVELRMATRHSDLAAISACEGAWVLRQFNRPSPTRWFILGNLAHDTIDGSVRRDLDLVGALELLDSLLDRALAEIDGQTVLGGVEGLAADGARLVGNWFRFTHPDSPKRLEIYDDYEWPPQTEVDFQRTAKSAGTKYPVVGRLDALFTPKTGERYLLVDWKSGGGRVATDSQLQTYRFGCQAGEWLAAFHYLDRIQPRAVVKEGGPYPGDDVVRARILRVEATKERLLANRRTRFKASHACRQCIVREDCPIKGPDKGLAHSELIRNMRRLAST